MMRAVGLGEAQGHPPEIIIVSGGVGSSAEQLLYTVLAQFPNAALPVHTEGSVRRVEQVEAILAQAAASGALVIHTLVEAELRRGLVERARAMGVMQIDLMGTLIDWITSRTGQGPLEQPGLYRRLNRDYFERVSAIDFTIAHDDGKNIEDLAQAEIILMGVSRVGKTPLSLYLAVLGWKVANWPMVPGFDLPEVLFRQPHERVFGLTIAPEQLLVYRSQRQARLGVSGTSNYVNLDAIQQELKQASRTFRAAGFPVIDMTDKTIELAADEILRRIAGQKNFSLGG